MKIQNISNYMSYKSSSKAVRNEEAIRAKKYDVIDIKSSIADEHANADIVSIKRDIVSKVNQETKAAKLSRIKNNVNDNTYRIDAGEIVQKLLK